MSRSPLAEEVFAAFSQDLAITPLITLRGGNSIDDYCTSAVFDPVLDNISDLYIETYCWGISYLDPSSWRHYLPSLIEYALRTLRTGSHATSILLDSLRPPDRNPPRLASLKSQQEQALVAAIEVIAFTNGSVYSDDACQVLEEWWLPHARYRPTQK